MHSVIRCLFANGQISSQPRRLLLAQEGLFHHRKQSTLALMHRLWMMSRN